MTRGWSCGACGAPRLAFCPCWSDEFALFDSGPTSPLQRYADDLAKRLLCIREHLLYRLAAFFGRGELP